MPLDRHTADRLVALAVVGLALVGLVLTWQALTTYGAAGSYGSMGSMMDGSMGGMMTTGAGAGGISPIWPFLGTVAVVVLVGGGYLLFRDEVTKSAAVAGSGTTVDSTPGPAATTAPDGEPIERDPTDAADGGAVDPDPSARRLLDVLPDDERRVLEPVIASPGITQIELRDRSDFSKSKVSQTVSELEKRGLLYRERQGRTYRIYPDDDLGQG